MVFSRRGWQQYPLPFYNYGGSLNFFLLHENRLVKIYLATKNIFFKSRFLTN